MIAESIDEKIKERVAQILNEKEVIEYDNLIATDNLGEILEKLIILHIRTWNLEDKIAVHYNNDKEVAGIKRKIDVLFKDKRPKLISAFNKLIDSIIKNEKTLVEENVKLYKGHQN